MEPKPIDEYNKIFAELRRQYPDFSLHVLIVLTLGQLEKRKKQRSTYEQCLYNVTSYQILPKSFNLKG